MSHDYQGRHRPKHPDHDDGRSADALLVQQHMPWALADLDAGQIATARESLLLLVEGFGLMGRVADIQRAIVANRVALTR